MSGGGMNVLGGAGSLLGGFGAREEASGATKQQQTLTNRALNILSPQQIQAYIKQFYPMYFSQMNGQMQNAQQNIANQGARHGLTGTGAAQQLAAGVPGQFSGMALQEAIKSALGTSSQKASIQAGQKFAQQPSLWTVGGNTLTSLGGQNPQPYNSGPWGG